MDEALQRLCERAEAAVREMDSAIASFGFEKPS